MFGISYRIFGVPFTVSACVVVAVVLLYFLRRYMAGGVCRCAGRLEGKTVIITGANIGIGEATALALAKKGARLVLACRNMDKAEVTADRLKRLSNNNQIVIAKLDLASFASVRRFCEYIHTSEKRLDILINNAGVYWLPRTVTEDGNELQFQTNYLGHFLVTLLLLNKMRKNPVARIINVSSIAHNSAIDFDDLDGSKSYSKQTKYNQSKLAQLLSTRLLAAKLKNAGEWGITVNALHPGVVRTDILRTLPFLSSRIGKIANWPFLLLLFKSCEQGAQTNIHCCVSDECRIITGRYFKDCKLAEPAPLATNDHEAERLWNVSLKLVGLTKDDPAIECLNVTSKKSE